MTRVDLVQCPFLKAQGYNNVSSLYTGQYGKMFPESGSLQGHCDFQRPMSSAQVESLYYAVRYLCGHFALAGSRKTISAINHSVWLSSAACVLSGIATGVLESASAVCRNLPAS